VLSSVCLVAQDKTGQSQTATSTIQTGSCTLRNYLTQLQRATAKGVPVKGYFVWGLLDHFEWSSSYAKRFGLT
jgi:hypothetical protein